VHDKSAPDERFLDGLLLIERESTDARNFVKKAVNMALRATGKRNRALRAAAVEVARRLAESNDPTARWNGKDALRALA
jgi:3-methyladenine DNA glycosylase AlkD